MLQIDDRETCDGRSVLASTFAVYIRLTMEKNYTYLVRCADGTLYCGWTNHLEKRMDAHNEGRGAKYTKGRRPVTLVYYEEYETKSEAMRREAELKKLTKEEKERMIASGREI